MKEVTSRIAAFVLLAIVPALGIAAIWLAHNVSLAGRVGGTAGILCALFLVIGCTYGGWLE